MALETTGPLEFDAIKNQGEGLLKYLLTPIARKDDIADIRKFLSKPKILERIRRDSHSKP